MKTTRFVVVGALCAWILSMTSAFAADDARTPFGGNWTVMPGDSAATVNFGLVRRHKGGQWQTSSDWPVSAFEGVDFAERGRRNVQFAVTREAGRFDCEGYLDNGVGAGVFLFTADPAYVDKMSRLGFTGIDADMQFGMASADVTSEFARQMQAEKLTRLGTDKLIALRIFDVTPRYIRDLRAQGLPMSDSDKVIAFRVHRITVESVRAIRELGIEADEDQLIAMHVHQVTPEYIGEIEKLGLGRPDPNQLIAMRVHDVSPGFIERMQSRGLKQLTIDRLIQLRVHGID